MFDHSHADPAHPHRATANPWASQRHSYADRLYNGQYNMSGPAYLPTDLTPSQSLQKTHSHGVSGPGSSKPAPTKAPT